MNDQKTIAELKKLQTQAHAINTKLTALMENRRQIADPAIAETRLENFGDDIETIISDLSHANQDASGNGYDDEHGYFRDGEFFDEEEGYE